MGVTESLIESATHWNNLANEAESFAEYEERRGHYGGVYRNKAFTYRRTVLAIFMEQETGVWHCSCCLEPIRKVG